jgi:Tol biopolymer transport system component
MDVVKSPDGDRAAFREQGGITIYFINTEDEKRVAYWGSYSWAPDGKSIYILGRESSEAENPKAQIKLFRYGLENDSSEEVAIDSQEKNFKVGGEITVSPSGTRIIFQYGSEDV